MSNKTPISKRITPNTIYMFISLFVVPYISSTPFNIEYNVNVIIESDIITLEVLLVFILKNKRRPNIVNPKSGIKKAYSI